MSKPVFIVGMPRSGTKLLRGILNNHPKISVLTGETEFLSYWDKKWSSWEGVRGLIDYNNFLKFYKDVISLPYFISKSYQSKLIPPDEWYNKCENFTLSAVFEALARHDAAASDDMIWGDKSPSYIRHISLIKKHFPEAQIIHIVRDVRDYCLSINKAWGKNMLRAAQRWTDNVGKARQDGAKYQNDYLEIRYEDLLETPEIQIQNVCSFLGIQYGPNLLILEKPSENIGDARGKYEIVKKNVYKYKSNMSFKLQSKIEQIAFPELQHFAYPTHSFARQKRINCVQYKCYQLLDGINLVRSRQKHTGNSLVEAIRFHLRAKIQSK